MVLTKDELISALQHEVRVLVHLAGKVDQLQLDYRPTPKQRSTLELLQYLAIMGPTSISSIQSGSFDRASLSAIWTQAEARSRTMTFIQAVAAIQALSSEYCELFSGWSDADFRSEIDFFGRRASRGSLLVSMVLSAHAAYRTQFFCYLKSCGRDELNTMNLWGGVDGPS